MQGPDFYVNHIKQMFSHIPSIFGKTTYFATLRRKWHILHFFPLKNSILGDIFMENDIFWLFSKGPEIFLWKTLSQSIIFSERWFFIKHCSYCLGKKNHPHKVVKNFGNKNGLKVLILSFLTLKISHILVLWSHFLLFFHHIKMTYFGSKNHIEIRALLICYQLSRIYIDINDILFKVLKASSMYFA